MNKNQFIAFTCFAVCFCISKLEKKKKRITLYLPLAIPIGTWKFFSDPPGGIN